MEQLHTASGLAVRAKQVHVEIGPLVHKRRAADQAIDQLGALVGRGIRKKLLEIGGGGDASGQVEGDAAEKLLIGGERRVRYPVALQLSEDKSIDEVAARDLSGCGRGW